MPASAEMNKGIAPPDHLAFVLHGEHPVRLAGAAALLPDLTPAGLVALIDAVRRNAFRAGVQRGVRAAAGRRS